LTAKFTGIVIPHGSDARAGAATRSPIWNSSLQANVNDHASGRIAAGNPRLVAVTRWKSLNALVAHDLQDNAQHDGLLQGPR